MLQIFSVLVISAGGSWATGRIYTCTEVTGHFAVWNADTSRLQAMRRRRRSTVHLLQWNILPPLHLSKGHAIKAGTYSLPTQWLLLRVDVNTLYIVYIYTYINIQCMFIAIEREGVGDGILLYFYHGVGMSRYQMHGERMRHIGVWERFTMRISPQSIYIIYKLQIRKKRLRTISYMFMYKQGKFCFWLCTEWSSKAIALIKGKKKEGNAIKWSESSSW